MTGNLRILKGLAMMAAIVTIGCIVAALVIGMASPETIPNAALGPDWQCTRFALVFTTCSRVRHAASAQIRVRGEPMCLEPRL
jgi:hypothetical protein